MVFHVSQLKVAIEYKPVEANIPENLAAEHTPTAHPLAVLAKRRVKNKETDTIQVVVHWDRSPLHEAI